MQPQKLLGRVQTVIKKGALGYGFIESTDHRKFFFHQQDVVEGILPGRDTLVSFQWIEEPLRGKSPRAIKVEIVSAPSCVSS